MNRKWFAFVALCLGMVAVAVWYSGRRPPTPPELSGCSIMVKTPVIKQSFAFELNGEPLGIYRSYQSAIFKGYPVSGTNRLTITARDGVLDDPPKEVSVVQYHGLDGKKLNVEIVSWSEDKRIVEARFDGVATSFTGTDARFSEWDDPSEQQAKRWTEKFLRALESQKESEITACFDQKDERKNSEALAFLAPAKLKNRSVAKLEQVRFERGRKLMLASPDGLDYLFFASNDDQSAKTWLASICLGILDSRLHILGAAGQWTPLVIPKN